MSCTIAMSIVLFNFFSAPWRGQDVLARARSTDIYDRKYCVPVPSINQIRQDYCRFDCPSDYACVVDSVYADQIKTHIRESKKHRYILFLVPRTSTLVSRILEEEGILGDITISSYNLQFIPIADDVISLENDNAFKEIWVVCIFSILQQYSIAQSLQ